MAQNIYDDPNFFAGYAKLNRSIHGLNGAPEWESIHRMLPPLKDIRVVDLGCGYGWFSRYARGQGAQHVLAVDVSEKMLAKAQEMTSDNAIEYRREDLESLCLEENTYHLAYASLVLHYIENLSPLLTTVFRSLVPGGHFVFTAEHPIYTAPRNPEWNVDSQGNKSWPLNNYHVEGPRITNWLAEGVVKQHRMVGTYLNMFLAAGFQLTHLEEWGPTEQQLLQMPELRDEQDRPMMFLASFSKPHQ